MTLAATIKAAATFVQTSTNDNVKNRSERSFAADIVFADGSAAGQANKVFDDQRILAASTSENLDLAGTLLDQQGAFITFATVKAIVIRAAAANTNDVVVGGAASNGFLGPFGAAAHTAAVRPGGAVVFVAPAAGWAVTAGTADLLKIANGGAGTPVTYDVTILGT